MAQVREDRRVAAHVHDTRTRSPPPPSRLRRRHRRRIGARRPPALQYREYDFVTRLVMRVLMRRAGHTTDVWRDHEYTDWDAVERFARDCVAMAAEG